MLKPYLECDSIGRGGLWEVIWVKLDRESGASRQIRGFKRIERDFSHTHPPFLSLPSLSPSLLPSFLPSLPKCPSFPPSPLPMPPFPLHKQAMLAHRKKPGYEERAPEHDHAGTMIFPIFPILRTVRK